MRVALLLVLASCAFAETYLGYTGRWVEVEATAYSPHDQEDSHYHATKGTDRWMTAGRVSDVRRVPYGVAAPLPGSGVARHLTLPLRTQVIIPQESGYLAQRENRVFMVDDTGGRITSESRRTGRMHIDLRMKLESDAFAYNQGKGRYRFRIFVISGRAPVLVPVAEVQQAVEPVEPSFPPHVLSAEPTFPPLPPIRYEPIEPVVSPMVEMAMDVSPWVYIPWAGIVLGLFYIGFSLGGRR